MCFLSSGAVAAGVKRPDWSQAHVLHLVNKAGGGHDFVAERFFTAAQLAPSDRATVTNGEVELGAGESADVRLVAPQPGTYDVHCWHFMQSTFGMTGKIVVS